jgi:hypothetical protein
MASLFTPPFLDVGAGLTTADGALLNFFVVGSGTRKNTFTTAAATTGTEHANPVVADALGVFPAIFLSGDYDWTLQDKNAVQRNSGSVSELAVAGTVNAETVIPLSTVAALQAADLTGFTAVQTLGYTTAGDGGAGLYRADTGDTSTVDDGFLCIVSNDSVRFKLVLDGDINMLQAGVTKDNTESSARQQVVMDYCRGINATPCYPDGLYKIGTTIDISSPGGGVEAYRNLEVKCGHESKFEGTSNAITLFNIEGQKLFKWSGGWFRVADVCFQGAIGPSGQPPDAYAHFSNIIFEATATGSINKCYSSTSPIGSYWTDCDFGTDARSDGIAIAVDMGGNDVGQSNLAKFTRCCFKGMYTGGVNMPDSIYARFGTSFTDCRFETISGYALTIGTNSRDVRLTNCYFEGCGSVSVSPIVMTGGKLTFDGGQIAGSQTNTVAFIDANGASIEIETRGKIEYLATTATTEFVKYSAGISQPQYLKGVSIQGSGTETYKSLLFSTATQAQEQFIEWEVPRLSSTLIDTQISKTLLGNHSHKGFISYETEIVNLAAATTNYDLCNINIPTNSQGLRFSVESYQTVQAAGHTGQFNEWVAYYNSGGATWTFVAVDSATTVAGFTFTPTSVDANNFKIEVQRSTGGASNSPFRALVTIRQAAYLMEGAEIVVTS